MNAITRQPTVLLRVTEVVDRLGRILKTPPSRNKIRDLIEDGTLRGNYNQHLRCYLVCARSVEEFADSILSDFQSN